MFDSVWQDLRYATRSMLRRPLVTAVAVLSLALGIGVNTAIFSVFDRYLLRRLPVPAPHEIVLITASGPRPGATSTTNAGGREHIFSSPLFRDLERLEGTGLSHVAAHSEFAANLSFDGQTERGNGLVVSGRYFPALQLTPAAGRLLTANDDSVPGGHPVAVLSHRYWTMRFGANPAVVGRTLTINGHPFTIVGVAPDGFTGTTMMELPQVFVPLAMREQVRAGGDARNNHWLYVLGRLAPGVSREQAEAGLNVPFAGLTGEVEFPALRSGMGDRAREQFLARRIVLEEGELPRMSDRDEASIVLTFMLAVTGLVLLIACANVANLQMARGADRAGEIAIRLAIGASGGRLLRLMLMEALLLGTLGAGGALLVAQGTVQSLVALMPLEDQPLLQFELSTTILLFSLTLGLGTGLLFGIFPALHSIRSTRAGAADPTSGRASASRGAARFRSSLAAAQIALATVLLAQAGLFITSLVNVSRVELGIQREGVVTFRLSPYLNGYSAERALALVERVQDDLRGLPNVISVSASSNPVLADSVSSQNLTVEGFDAGPDTDTIVRSARVAPDYFRTLGIALVAGREFTRTDVRGTPMVAVVNEAFARKFALRDAVLGTHVALGQGDNVVPEIEIVGLVRDTTYNDVKEPPPAQLFLPYQQHGWGGLTLYVRSSANAAQLPTMIPPIVKRADPTLPVERLRTMDDQIVENTIRDRLLTTLSSSFAGLAVLLAGIGLYAVLAFSVAHRVREMGIRMALGARPADVRRLVLRHVGRITAVGGAIGLVAAIALARLARALLFGVEGHDPRVIGSAAVAVTLVALLAAALPARRATTVDPAIALRAE